LKGLRSVWTTPEWAVGDPGEEFPGECLGILEPGPPELGRWPVAVPDVLHREGVLLPLDRLGNGRPMGPGVSEELELARREVRHPVRLDRAAGAVGGPVQPVGFGDHDARAVPSEEYVRFLARPDRGEHLRDEAAVEELGGHFGRAGFAEGDGAGFQFPAYARVQVRCVGHSLV